MPFWPTTPAETWAAVTALATVAAFAAAGVYALLTFRLLTLTRAMLEREDKPLLRLSAVKAGALPAVINVGRGVAFTSVVLEDRPKLNLLRFFWTIRPGERVPADGLQFAKGVSYVLYYQDVAGRWYLTSATPEAHRTHNRFHGIVPSESVPDIVQQEAQVDGA